MNKLIKLVSKGIVLSALSLCLTTQAMAEENHPEKYNVILKSGTVIKGKIISKTYEGIKINSSF